jgi:hypothetical protein
MQELKEVLQNGWPNRKYNVPHSAMIYFDVRDELTVQNGLIFKEESCNTDIFEIRYDQAYSHFSYRSRNFCPSISLDQLQPLTMDDSVFREILEFPSVVSFRK